MKKQLMSFVLLATLGLVGCSTKTIVNEEAKGRKFRRGNIYSKIDSLVEEDGKLTAEQKSNTKKILYHGLDRSRELRHQESALASEVLRMSLVDNASFSAIKAKKSEMKKIYMQKYENFYETIAKLKKELGIRPENNRLIHSPIMDRIFRRGSRSY